MSEGDVTPVRAVVCSHNRHKTAELQQLLPHLQLEPLAPDAPTPDETGITFEENARIKALAGAALHPGTWVIADDSGLCVDALDGGPGVLSARYAGPDADDDDNNAKLLERLARETEPDARRARFVCVLVAIAPDGRELVAEGVVEGHIADRPAGDAGFGYDPLFVPAGYEHTFGVLGSDVKQSLSHRAAAARALAERLPGALQG